MSTEALRNKILTGSIDYLIEAERIGPPALTMLSELLEHKNGEIRTSALSCVALIDDDSVPGILIKALGDSDERVFNQSLQTLRSCQLDLSHLAPLAEHLKHTDPEIRAGVALLVGGFDHQSAVTPLKKQLSNETDPEAIKSIKLALARLGDTDCREEIVGRLAAPDPEERLKTLDDLDYIGDANLAGSLLPLLDDQEEGYDVGDNDNPESARICDAVINLISDWHQKPFSFEVHELNIYTEEQVEEVRTFVKSLGE